MESSINNVSSNLTVRKTSIIHNNNSNNNNTTSNNNNNIINSNNSSSSNSINTTTTTTTTTTDNNTNTNTNNTNINTNTNTNTMNIGRRYLEQRKRTHDVNPSKSSSSDSDSNNNNTTMTNTTSIAASSSQQHHQQQHHRHHHQQAQPQQQQQQQQLLLNSSSSNNNNTTAPSNSSGSNMAAVTTSTTSSSSSLLVPTVVVPKVCHSGLLAMLMAQNVTQMGARIQLNLCPPGTNRRILQRTLRKKNVEGQQQLQNMSLQRHNHNHANQYHQNQNQNQNQHWQHRSMNGLEQFIGVEQLEDYEVQEEDFLINYQTDSDEEASSGDDDELLDMDELFSEESIDLNTVDNYHCRSEPLMAPVIHPTDTANAGGSQGSKFPFNRRKIRFFDMPTAEEAIRSRQYIKQEYLRSRQRAALRLCHRLKQINNSTVDSRSKDLLHHSHRSMEDDENNTTTTTTTTLATTINQPTPFDAPMTPPMAVSLLQESLLVNVYESVEGMGACYDGIVAAGTALLETPDPTQPSQARAASRSEIMAALAPLLITTLEQPSGELLLLLARLRRLCATARYRRRFVQRIAPILIRPPGAAVWSLRHHNDMEAIFAATELILDAAFDVFSKGWYDRGRWMLADSKRAETLQVAAQQLRSLSRDDGLAFLSNTHPQRRVRLNDAGGPLAEWEVIAVDRQIRLSIQSVLNCTNWTITPVGPETMRSMASRRRQTYAAAPRSRENSTGHEVTSDARSLSPPLLEGSSPQQTSGYNAKNNTHIPLPKSPKSPHRGTGTTKDDRSQDVTASPKRTVSSLSTPSFTPLSPSASSVGSTGGGGGGTVATGNSGSGDMVSYRSMSPQSASSTSHYRMLTSTAAERKRTVAACRALRAQISRFEDAFIQLHGRPPKGAADRAPLATTYAQYREWKRAIRADAACRIQALFRSACCRWKLLRLGNPAVAQVIMKKSGRNRGKNAIALLSLPHEIGQVSSPVDVSVARKTLSQESGTGGSSNNIIQHPLAPWGSPVITRSNSGGSGDGGMASSSPTTSPVTYTHPMPSMNLSTMHSIDSSTMSFADLQARKRDLKQQLKQYDMNFARKHGRMPVKAEKEPIRHLYEAYNTLKSEISQIEQDGRQSTTGSSASPLAQIPMSQQQRTVSPLRLDGIDDSAAEVRLSPTPLSRNKRKLPKPSQSMTNSSIGSSMASASTATIAIDGPQELAALKTEKSNLHTMLRTYERDFYRENNRQVSSFADIKPVASQYRRYKEIKKAIASAQQQPQQHGEK